MASRFDDARLPVWIERGARHTLQSSTVVTRLQSGRSVANQLWAQHLDAWDISYGLQELDNPVDFENGVRAIMNFYRARAGRARTFRFRDWLNYQLVDEQIGVGDASTTVFQISKTINDAAAFSYTSNITKPSQAGTIAGFGADPAWGVKINDVAFGTEGVDWTINYSTGEITFASAPAAAATIKVSGNYDKHVSFAEDRLELRIEWAQAVQTRPIELQEERD